MNNKNYFFKPSQTGLLFNTGILIALAGCLNYADAQGVRIIVPVPTVVVSTPVVAVPAPAVVIQDNYVYYPAYGVYYNTSRQQYAYMDGSAWVFRAAPMGVSAGVLLASPSVKMDFHDSPANHHADIAQKYPKSYTAVRSEQKTESHVSHEGHEGHEGHEDRHDK